MAGLARENLETALKELGHLLEFAREGAIEDGEGGGGGKNRPLNTAALSTWDRSKGEAKRFARVMVSRAHVFLHKILFPTALVVCTGVLLGLGLVARMIKVSLFPSRGQPRG